MAARMTPTNTEVGEFRLCREVLDADDQVHQVGHLAWAVVVGNYATDRDHVTLQRREAANRASLGVDPGRRELAAKMFGGLLQDR